MKKTPDWKLERYILKELEEPFTPSKDDLLRIEELKKENNIFLNKIPFEKLNFKKESSFKKIFKLFLYPKYSLALSFIIIFSIGVFFNTSSETRIKSSDINKLTFNILENNKINEIDSSYKLKEGDLIQISYLISNYKYALIFSIDANDNINIHLPYNKEPYAAPVNNNKKTNLAFAYKLDTSPYFEKFYLVLADSSFNIDYAIDKIKNNSRNNNKFKVLEYYFEKE